MSEAPRPGSSDEGVARIDLFAIAIPLTHTYRDATRSETHSRDLVVRLTTGGGAIGWGAGAPRTVPTGETLDASFAVARDLAPTLLGRNPFAIEAARRAMDGAIPLNHAVRCAFDLALHDLAARLIGRPVHDLLGGRVRDAMPTFELLPLESPERVAELAQAARTAGTRAFKVKVDRDVATGVARVEAVRAVVPDATIVVDANGAWSVAEAIDACRAFGDAGAGLVEQPVAAADLDGLVAVHEQSAVSISADESMRPDLVGEVLRRRAVDVVNIKLNREGGLMPSRHVAAAAAICGVSAICGSVVQNALIDAACAQFFASTPGITINESGKAATWHATDIATGLDISDGLVHVPRGLGLGVDVDEEAVRGFAFASETISR